VRNELLALDKDGNGKMGFNPPATDPCWDTPCWLWLAIARAYRACGAFFIFNASAPTTIAIHLICHLQVRLMLMN
jgi:hypothetical protein